ncbi:MAG: hypothetical protein LBL61_06550 [Elusimicrobiota bacterium]|jgi:hypothetical protein|nr:hypothetical protein [Elusimicrobiota bacterium]
MKKSILLIFITGILLFGCSQGKQEQGLQTVTAMSIAEDICNELLIYKGRK